MTRVQLEFRSNSQFFVEGLYAGYLQERRTAGTTPLHLARRTAQPGRVCAELATPHLVLSPRRRVMRFDFGAGLFKSSGFGAAFRRMVGACPRAWRRERLL